MVTPNQRADSADQWNATSEEQDVMGWCRVHQRVTAALTLAVSCKILSDGRGSPTGPKGAAAFLESYLGSLLGVLRAARDEVNRP